MAEDGCKVALTGLRLRTLPHLLATVSGRLLPAGMLQWLARRFCRSVKGILFADQMLLAGGVDRRRFLVSAARSEREGGGGLFSELALSHGLRNVCGADPVSLRGRKVLFLLPGDVSVDVLRALPGVRECEAEILSLNGRREGRASSDLPGSMRFLPLYPGADITNNEAFRISRRFVDALVERLDELFPGDADLARMVADQRQAVVNLLHLEVGRRVEEVRTVRDVVHAREPDVIVVAEGGAAAGHLLAAACRLQRAGAVASVCHLMAADDILGTVQAAARAGTPRSAAVLHSFAASGTALKTALHRLVRRACRRVRLRGLADRHVLLADMRDAGDFRYRPTALALMEAMHGKDPLALLQPRNLYSRRMLARMARLKNAFPALKLVFCPSAYLFRCNGCMQMLAERMERVARQVLAGQEVPPLFREAVVGACRDFAGNMLPGIIALGEGLREAFRKRRPRTLTMLPATQPFMLVAGCAARAAGVPSVGITTLLAGNFWRECVPACDHLAVMDTHQASLLGQAYGFDADRFFLMGHVDNAKLLQLCRARQEVVATDGEEPGAHGQRKILFASQPLGGRQLQVLRWIVKAVQEHGEDVSLHVHAHPAESEVATQGARQLLREAGGAPKFVFAGKGTPLEAVAEADVVITIISNLGLRAAVAGKDVITARVFDVEPLISFADMGIALQARDAGEMKMLLDDVLAHGERWQQLQRTRQRYLEENPQMLSPRPAEHVRAFLLQLAERER